MENHFCTCPSKSCENHPSNQEKGCGPCVEKHLSRREVPACFFKGVSEDLKGLESFSFEGFAKFVSKHGKKNSMEEN